VSEEAGGLVLPADDRALSYWSIRLKWTKNRTTAKCGWCPCKLQTREHLFKNCPRWKPQQKTLRAEVRKETGRGKNRFTIQDLFADERCTRAILNFLRTTDGGAETTPERRARAEPGPGGRAR
jgi:hypothetical protein